MRRFALLWILLTAPHAQAADASFSVTPSGVAMVVHDQRLARGSLDLGLGVTARGPQGALYYRDTAQASLLGNLVWEVRAGHDAAGTRLASGLRGVLGPVALRSQLAVGNRQPGSPWPLLDGAHPPLPGSAAALGWGFDGELDATWRINRAWSIGLNPRLEYRSPSWAGGLSANIRRSGIAPDFDLSLQAVVQPPRAAATALLGVTLHHVPRRAPAAEAGVWLAAGGWGVHGRLARRDAGKLWQLQGALGLGPSGTPSDYLTATIEVPALQGTLSLGGGWSRAGPLAQLRLRIPLAP